MSHVTMIGCDLHDRMMLLQVAVDKGPAVTKCFATDDVPGLIDWLQAFAERRNSKRIVFAYEASGQGFGLCDALRDAGVECYVVPPTHLERTAHRRKNKTDEKDAEMILQKLRSYILAGNGLPTVWVPDLETRDDREIVRLRLELGEQRTRVKNQIRSLIKRTNTVLPPWFTRSGNWSCRSIQWLRDVANGKVQEVACLQGVDTKNDSPEVETRSVPLRLGEGARTTLRSLVELHENLCTQMGALDKAIGKLARTPRYAKAFQALRSMPGIGQLTAMVFLTEIGELNRFANRRKLAAYLGLIPAAYESGEQKDRKGHITRQGPARVRHVLCQAAWAAVRCSSEWRNTYERIKRGSKKRSKIAIVAVMRQLGIQMWQRARDLEVEQPDLEFDEPVGDVLHEERADNKVQAARSGSSSRKGHRGRPLRHPLGLCRGRSLPLAPPKSWAWQVAATGSPLWPTDFGGPAADREATDGDGDGNGYGD